MLLLRRLHEDGGFGRTRRFGRFRGKCGAGSGLRWNEEFENIRCRDEKLRGRVRSALKREARAQVPRVVLVSER